MRIDPHSHVPIFQQIADELRSAIAAGVHRPGEPLPSQRTLALRLGVNPNTVQRAFEQLERDGFTRSRKGLGMFVAENGAATARSDAEEALRAELERALRNAAAAGLSNARVRQVFSQAQRDAESPSRSKS